MRKTLRLTHAEDAGMGKEVKAKADNGMRTRRAMAREAREVGQLPW